MSFLLTARNVYSQTRSNLEVLESQYRSARSIRGKKGGILQELYSKTAIIELNSCIEMFEDEFCKSKIISSTINPDLKQQFEDQIENTYDSKFSFRNKNSFLNTLLDILGSKKYSKLAASSDFAQLKSKVNLISDKRNDIAHVPATGIAAPPLQSPSWCLRELDEVYVLFRKVNKIV